MVVSSGFLDHAAEVYLRTNGIITSAQPPIVGLNRATVEWSQQPSTQSSQQPPQQNQQSQQTQIHQQQLQPMQTNHAIMQQATTIKVKNGQPPPARAILICHSNSHPFQTRNILLEPRQEVKVGRSVPRSRVEESNAIFDCKVLSRNHAIIWFVDGKFFIKDTGSSNGTFINSQRIKSSESYEISSGDIVQFGVDVIENSRKETHGCIIAVLKLITPDGLEKTSYQQQLNPSACTFDNDIFRLKQIMHESYLRELLLEEKLVNLQKEVLTTWTNSSNTWQAMIHEDLLLSRIDILENKLSCYQKNITNEKLLEEINKLQDDKEIYQKTAKEALKKVYQDRMAVIQKFTKFEQFWQSSEDELMLLRSQLMDSKENNEKLLQEMNNSNTESIRAQMAKQELDCKTIKESFEAAKRENDELKSRLQLVENINESELLMAGSGEDGDKNKNLTMWSKQQEILQWLKNSDLKQLTESDDIINAMCNDTKHKEFLKIDPQKCAQLYDKLSDIEKRLTAANSKTADNKRSNESITDSIFTTKTEDAVGGTTNNDGNKNNEIDENKVNIEIEIKENNHNNDEHNDGNQNKQEDSDENAFATVRGVVGELKEMYNEFLIQIKLVQKDLIRAAKYDELETKLLSAMLELQRMQKQQQQQRKERITQNAFDDENGTHQINDANYDSTTVADDIIVLSGTDATNTSTHEKQLATATDSVDQKVLKRQNTITDADDGFDTNSMSTIDDTNHSSTNSIITAINSDVPADDLSEQGKSNLLHDYSALDAQIDRIELLSSDELSKDSTFATTKPANTSNAKSAGCDASDNDDDDEPHHHDNNKSVIEQIVTMSSADNIIDYDYADEKEALESFDRIIEEESKLINETDILREEELVELKERCIKLTDDNISLRREVDSLRLNSSRQLTLLLYTAPLAALIGYLFSLFFS